MNSTIQQAAMVLSVMFLAVSPANGGPPPNPTSSDATGNTAGGSFVLLNNTGSFNTAFGRSALHDNTTGSANTASGVAALENNTTGSDNTASGAAVLFSNTTGSFNAAFGRTALQNNTTGLNNAAFGRSALFTNTTGTNNTALGRNALLRTISGNSNLALGQGAGALLTSGSNNIYLSHPGVATESNTLRLGSTHTRTFIAGVFGKLVTGGAAVHVNSAGQLGTVVSSARYKQDIQPMGEQSAKVQQLRPVTFHYKEEPTGPMQYGLIAEEVAKVYPELVTRNADGAIEGVRYEELTPLLLNEVQRQQQELAELRAQNAQLQTALAQQDKEQRAQQAALAARLERLEAAGVRTTRAQR